MEKENLTRNLTKDDKYHSKQWCNSSRQLADVKD